MSEPGHRRRLIDALRTYFANNVKSWRLLSDGTYEKVAGNGRRVRAQGKFYRDAAHATPQCRPLTRPKPEE